MQPKAPDSERVAHRQELIRRLREILEVTPEQVSDEELLESSKKHFFGQAIELSVRLDAMKTLIKDDLRPSVEYVRGKLQSTNDELERLRQKVWPCAVITHVEPPEFVVEITPPDSRQVDDVQGQSLPDQKSA